MIVGYLALALFLATIVLSLKGIIPQNHIPIHTALLGVTLLIVLISVVGARQGLARTITPADLLASIQLHPITALIAGFLVVGGLEVSGAFEALVDALDRLASFKIGGMEVFGLPGVVVLLVNSPAIIALPCGRILGAALLPAALFLGRAVAERQGDDRLVAVVVFAFTVNAAASCAPSILGGLGMIGEGMTGQPVGAFSDPLRAGIMAGTAFTAVVLGRLAPLKAGGR